MDNPADITRLEGLGYSGPSGVGEAWLGVVWRSLQGELPGLAARITSGEVDVEAVADVVTAATLRILRNPEGWESQSTSIADYTESGSRGDSTQDVYFTAAELRRLASPSSYAGTFTGSISYVR